MQTKHQKKKIIEGKKRFSGSVGIDTGDKNNKIPSNVHIKINRLEKNKLKNLKIKKVKK